mmetsp:Transcript_111464/g.288163  ORF Transcript_111464/g.288163 Transcript_111464/m.288163 type:complete len:198 (+) Transcript_111464:237-830(+)
MAWSCCVVSGRYAFLVCREALCSLTVIAPLQVKDRRISCMTLMFAQEAAILSSGWKQSSGGCGRQLVVADGCVRAATSRVLALLDRMQNRLLTGPSRNPSLALAANDAIAIGAKCRGLLMTTVATTCAKLKRAAWLRPDSLKKCVLELKRARKSIAVWFRPSKQKCARKSTIWKCVRKHCAKKSAVWKHARKRFAWV